MPGGRGPADFVDDEGVEPLECLGQAAEVLVMVEGIAAGPVREPDMRVAQRPAVVWERLAWRKQHIGDARAGDEAFLVVGALWQRRDRYGILAPPVLGDRAQRITVSAAFQSHLPQQRGEHQAHPDRLFAMVCALQGVGHGHEDPFARQSQCELRDGRSVDAAQGGCPCRVLGQAIGAAEQIVFEYRPAVAEIDDEIPVMQARCDQRVRDAQHQRDIRARHHRQPGRGRLRGQIVPLRAYRIEAAAASGGLRHGLAFDVPADAAGGHARVLQRHAPKCQHDVGMPGDLFPGDIAQRDFVEAANHVRKHHLRGTRTV